MPLIIDKPETTVRKLEFNKSLVLTMSFISVHIESRSRGTYHWKISEITLSYRSIA